MSKCGQLWYLGTYAFWQRRPYLVYEYGSKQPLSVQTPWAQRLQAERGRETERQRDRAFAAHSLGRPFAKLANSLGAAPSPNIQRSVSGKTCAPCILLCQPVPMMSLES